MAFAAIEYFQSSPMFPVTLSSTTETVIMQPMRPEYVCDACLAST
jgi:hypothetical protein